MPAAILFPKVSLETDVGSIARWLKEDGATVQAGEALFEIDNDKAAVEVEASTSGTVVHLAGAGDEVKVGDVVGEILAAGEEAVSVETAADIPMPVAATPAAVVAQAADTSRATSRIVATPLARRMAAEGAIDLSTIRGSGPRGRVQKKDLLGAKSGDRPQSVPEGARLHAVWLQREGTATIVALHGFASDHNTWRSLLAAGRPKARFLAIELPGHGKSPRTIPADLDALCAMVEATMMAEGVESATLLGHSFGSAVAARLASRKRVAVRSLLMISPAGLGPEIRAEFLKGFVAARHASSLLPWLHELVADPSAISQAFLRSVEEQRRDDGLSQALQSFAEQYFCDGTQTFSIRADLEGLAIPARVIFGVQDRIIPFTHTRSLPGNIGLHAFPRCGHLPFLEQPRLTLSILDEMLTLGHASNAATGQDRHVA